MNKVYSKIESIIGSVITVRATGVKYNELAEIETSFGKSLAEVNRIDGDLVSLQVFAGGRGVSTGDQIRFLGHEMQVSFSDDLLGRIFNGSGDPRDNGPALQDNLVEIGGPSVNPAKRTVIVEGVSVATKHKKPRRMGVAGGIISQETPIYASKVMNVCAKCGAPTRVGRKVLEDGTHVRFCKKCGETF